MFLFCFRMLSNCFTYFVYSTVYFYIICSEPAIWSDLFLFTWQQQKFSWGRRWGLTWLDWALLVSLQGLQKSYRPLSAQFSPRSWPACAFASGLHYPPLNGRCWSTPQNTPLSRLCRRTPSTARLSSLPRRSATQLFSVSVKMGKQKKRWPSVEIQVAPVLSKNISNSVNHHWMAFEYQFSVGTLIWAISETNRGLFLSIYCCRTACKRIKHSVAGGRCCLFGRGSAFSSRLLFGN